MQALRKIPSFVQMEDVRWSMRYRIYEEAQKGLLDGKSERA